MVHCNSTHQILFECQGCARLCFNIGVRAMSQTNSVSDLMVLYCLFLSPSEGRQEIN